jgi:hemerythrin-like domain-containing protein
MPSTGRCEREIQLNQQSISRTIRADHSLAEPLGTWHADHRKFARLLDVIEQQFNAYEAGKLPDYELMRSAVYYLRHYPDRFHHPREDVAFNRLMRRDPQLRLDIEWCIKEHVLIAAAGEKLFNCLNQIIAGDVIEHSALKVAAATYLAYYRHHISIEEHQIIPRAVEHLRPDDWAAVSAIPSEPDPLFGTEVDARYREIRRHIGGYL